MAYTRRQVFDLIDAERDRQIKKHGEQDDNDDLEWLAILTEEIGEAAEAVVNARFHANKTEAEANLLEELVHCLKNSSTLRLLLCRGCRNGEGDE